HAEIRALGVAPLRPPRSEVSAMEALRDLWRGANLDAVETTEIAVQRTLADFRRLLDHQPAGSEHRSVGRRNGCGRRRTAQDAPARAPAGGCRGSHHLRCARQRDQGSRAKVITRAEVSTVFPANQSIRSPACSILGGRMPSTLSRRYTA